MAHALFMATIVSIAALALVVVIVPKTGARCGGRLPSFSRTPGDLSSSHWMDRQSDGRLYRRGGKRAHSNEGYVLVQTIAALLAT